MLALVGYVAIVQPKLLFTRRRGFVVGQRADRRARALRAADARASSAACASSCTCVYERPLRGFRARADARSVLIVGAGDGGRLLLREILRNPDLGYRPGRLRRRRPAQAATRGSTAGSRCSARPTSSAARARRRRARRGADRDPVGAGHAARAVVSACRERGVPVRTMPTVFELLQTGGAAHAPGARGAGRGRPRPRAGADGDRARRRLPDRPVSCSSPAPAARSAPSCAARSRACGPARLVLLDHAEDNLFEIERELVEDRHALNTVAVLADCKEEERMREVFAEHRPTVVFHAAAYKHVGLMETNPVEAVRNNALATRVMARVAGDIGDQGVRARLDRQGRRARDGDGRVEGARRVGGRGGRRAAIPDTAFSARALRQRARLLGLGGADLPPPDRRGRPGHGHRPADDALLHDDPGGGPARDPRRARSRAAARCSCSRWASRCRSSTWRRT